MKKLLTCLLCCTMLLCTGVSPHATDITNIDSSSKLLTLSGTSTTLNGKVSVIVTKPNGTTEGMPLSAITASNIFDKTVLVYEFETGADGSWSGDAYIPDPGTTEELYGWHNVYVSGEAEKRQFYLASPILVEQAVAAIKGASADSLKGILESYTYDNPALSLDLNGDYADFADGSAGQKFVHNTMISLLNAYTGEVGTNEVTESFHKAVEAGIYTYGSSADIETALGDNKLGITDIRITGIDSDETISLDDVISMYLSMRTATNEYAKVKEHIESQIISAAGLIRINASTKGEMVDILEDYNDVFLLDLEGDYAGLDPVRVTAKLLGSTFTDLETLRGAFNKAVIDVKNEESDTEENEEKGDTIIQINKDNGGGGGGIKKEDKEDTVTKEEEKEEIPTVPTGRFDDLGGAQWAAEYINILSEKGIVNGVADRAFAPLKEVTREEYLKMLIGAFGIDAKAGETPFSDVDTNMWYAPYVSWAVENGIIYGIDENCFGVGTPLTREQMAAISVRMMEKFSVKLSEKELGFTDSEVISDYARDAVEKIYSAQIIHGMPDGSFMPRANLNRAQAAKVITLIMKVGGLGE